jgi:replicative superfamily II helicase
MPPITQVADSKVLVDTLTFPYAKFPFEKFNVVQSTIVDYYDKDNNLIIATATSSGKTVVGEMCLSYEIRKRGGKGLYLVPLKALAQEKIDDWTDKSHHFGDLKISICTGDYRLTAERKAELDDADLIIMSYEMFNSRVRNIGSERSEFLLKVGTLVADEVHLLTVPNRGDHLEAGLMKFTELNPNCRLIFLSATLPNVDEISNWVSFILNHKQTILLKSTYRPCPLNLHYEKYFDGERNYYDNEAQKVNMALEIVEYYPDDKFLIFSHTKGTCDLMKNALKSAGIKCEVHNADLDKTKRTKIEKEFKTDKDLRVIVATSTLAWGLNLPARRVIILGVHRGLDEVAIYDITQMVGRAGRPAFDPAGDAYILLPERTYDMHRARIKKPQLIQSQMLAQAAEHHKVLAFHLVSEIHQENIKDRSDVHHWYERSLACFQSNDLNDVIVDNTLDLLKKCGAIWEEDGKLTTTAIGKIASLFYYSPFDVSDLKRNFTHLFDENKQSDDLWLSVALSNIDTHKFNIVSKAERDEMSLFANQVKTRFPGAVNEPCVKAAFAYHQMLNGLSNPVLQSLTRTLQFDFPRLNQVLQALDGFGGKWAKKSWWNELQLRINYGVKGPMLTLCQLPNIGKARATKLWNAGIRSLLDIVVDPVRVKKLTGLKEDKVKEIILEAKSLLSSSP